MRIVAFALLAIATVSGCTTAEQRVASKKNEDWLRTQPVYVRAFDAEDVLTVGTSGSVKGVGAQMAKGVVGGLGNYQIKARYLKAAEPVPTDGVIVQGEVGRLFLGDARSWVSGLSNGKATCSASGTVKTGDRLVGEFNASEDSSMGAFSSDYLKMLDECVEFLTADIAEQIATGRYKSADD
jgi:hypothetical protein